MPAASNIGLSNSIGLRGRTGHETDICHISKTTHPILTKFAPFLISSLYEKKVTCEIISNSFECNHGNRIIAYIWLEVNVRISDNTSGCAMK